MLVDVAKLEELLRSIADEALEYYDRGDRLGAFACFLREIGRHPETATIASDPFCLDVVRAHCRRGRAAFVDSILGCAG